MVHIPLEKRLRKRQHVEIARLQDLLLDAAYSANTDLVFHGGTAIWRCYGGGRFSEDLDFYGKGIDVAALKLEIERRGAQVTKLKDTGNVIFCTATSATAEAKLEINKSRFPKKSVPANYERVDGGMTIVLTISPEDLILEKIAAYSSRKLARDIYDIFHLAGLCEKLSPETKKSLAGFLKNPPLPADEDNLKAVVYSGISPSFSQLVGGLRRLVGK